MSERDGATENRIRQLAEDMAAAGYSRTVDEAAALIVNTITSAGPPIRSVGEMLPSRWHPVRRYKARREFRTLVEAHEALGETSGE